MKDEKDGNPIIYVHLMLFTLNFQLQGNIQLDLLDGNKLGK